MTKLPDMLVSENATLNEVMESLNRSAAGIVFVVDDDEKMRGVLTDGDVRRAILGGAERSSPVDAYVNRDFKFATESDSRQDAIALLNDRIRHLPILDDDGRPVDLLSWADFWRLPVMEPALGGNELKYVMDCVTSGWISSKGDYVTRFEEAFCEYLGVEYALSTSSGTTALHLGLVAMGLEVGDEVIVPDLTFGASANVVVHCGATPVFVDVDRETWTLDPEQVAAKITPKTRAIMPVHLYGHPADMQPLQELADAHDLFIIEDAAEALGAKYKDQFVGSIGSVSAFSFFANKIITTGEGGMVTTNEPEIYEKMVVMRAHGMEANKRYWHHYAGYNYRMTNLQAAIGLAQMEQIDKFLAYRKNVIERYNTILIDVPGITLPPQTDWATNIFWLYRIIIEDSAPISRDDLIIKLSDYGIETRPFFYPLHMQPAYNPYSDGTKFPNSVYLGEHGLSLPTANDIKLDHVDLVANTIAHLMTQTVEL
ncbi:MAG: aminotransferase class I/II-fold pyridoxal phosphate-dependent enzyme [Chloroflexota bacterium]